MATYTFEKIKTKRTHRWVDCDGKKRQHTKTFFQTLNPFNTNRDGSIKTYEQILKEINAEADAWLNKETNLETK